MKLLRSLYHLLFCKNKILCISPDGTAKRKLFVRGLSIQFKGSNSTVILHKPFKFRRSKFILKNNCRIEIMEHSEIRKLRTTDMHNFSELKIGKNFYCGSCKIYLHDEPHKQITIGDDCIFSTDILLRTSDAHAILNTHNITQNKPQNIIIQNNVWIGMNVLILKGSIIPDNSIVAAGSVYTRKTYQPKEDEEIIGLNGRVFMGNPAKCVKHGDFTWRRETCTELEEKLKAEQNQPI